MNSYEKHSSVRQANTTTHGLTSTGLLRCRVGNCFYWEVCPLQSCIEDTWYGYYCPIEIERFKESFHAYEKSLAYLIDSMDKDKLDGLIFDLSMTEIKAMRADNAIAVSVAGNDNQRGIQANPPHINTIFRYRYELYTKRSKLFKIVCQLRESPVPLN